MHYYVALLAAASAVSATYVEPYQSSAKAYPQGDYAHTVMEYKTYQRRGHKYHAESYSTPAPYSSEPAPYPTPYSSEPAYPEYSYSFSSSSSSMPPSFIDGTGIGDLDDNLDNLPVADKRDYVKKYPKTYGTPASYSSPAPTPYPSEKPYKGHEYEYSYSSSSSSMAPSFIDGTGIGTLDDNLDNLPVADKAKRGGDYPKHYTSSAAPSYSYSASYSYSYSYSSSSSSAPAGSAAAGGLGGLLGELPIRRHEPTGSHSKPPHASGSAKADPLGGLLGDLPLA